MIKVVETMQDKTKKIKCCGNFEVKSDVNSRVAVDNGTRRHIIIGRHRLTPCHSNLRRVVFRSHSGRFFVGVF